MSYRRLNYDEQVELLTELFAQYKIGVEPGEIENVVACVELNDLTTYMADIGILVTDDVSGVYTNVSTINNDKEWIRLKLEALWQRFNG